MCKVSWTLPEVRTQEANDGVGDEACLLSPVKMRVGLLSGNWQAVRLLVQILLLLSC